MPAYRGVDPIDVADTMAAALAVAIAPNPSLGAEGLDDPPGRRRAGVLLLAGDQLAGAHRVRREPPWTMKLVPGSLRASSSMRNGWIGFPTKASAYSSSELANPVQVL